MKLNSHIVFLIAIVGIITAGVVGATLLSNGTMKQVDFDGIKVSVPSDADFVKTGDGYADTKYGISIHTFKNNESMVNYLKGMAGAKVISLKNQPPESVAFILGDDTNVLISNGGEGISIGAKDQALLADMSNSVVFSNHQKSVKPHPSIPGIAPPHLEISNDFNLIMVLMAQVNTVEFNPTIFEANITAFIDEYNTVADQGDIGEYTSSQVEITTSDNNTVDNNQNTSLLDNPQVSDVVSSISSDSGAAGGEVQNSSNGGVVPSISSDSSPTSNPSSSSPSVSSSSGHSGSASSGSSEPQKLTKQELKELLTPTLPAGHTIKKIKDEGDYYLVSIADSSGNIQKLKYDPYTGQQIMDGNTK